MKFCPHCGASLADVAASFCPECGNPLRVNVEAAARKPDLKETTHEIPVIPPPAEKAVHRAQVEPPAAPVPEPQKEKRRKSKPTRRRRGEKKQKQGQTDGPETGGPPPEPGPTYDGYDGYYEDILPVDEGQRKTERLDPDMMKKVALIAGGTLLIVAVAIVALLLM